MTALKTVEFFGEQYAINAEVSPFALIEFAEAASDGQDGDTMEGLASMMRLLKSCIAKDDVVEVGQAEGDDERQVTTVVAYGLKHFLAVCRREKAGAEVLVPVLQATFNAETDRPTERPSDSSAGPSATPLKSVSSSDGSDSAQRPTPSRVRPDLALVLSNAG